MECRSLESEAGGRASAPTVPPPFPDPMPAAALSFNNESYDGATSHPCGCSYSHRLHTPTLPVCPAGPQAPRKPHSTPSLHKPHSPLPKPPIPPSPSTTPTPTPTYPPSAAVRRPVTVPRNVISSGRRRAHGAGIPPGSPPPATGVGAPWQHQQKRGQRHRWRQPQHQQECRQQPWRQQR